MLRFSKNLNALALASLCFAPVSKADQSVARNVPGKIRQVVVDGCLAQFPDHPFGTGQVTPRVVAPSINVLTRTSTLNEDKITNNPELVIIVGTVNILGNSEFKLLNPNGWYCIPTNLSVFGTTSIDLNVNAHLAQLNVPIGSTVTVRKVGDDGKPIEDFESAEY